MMYNDLTQEQAKATFSYVDGQLFWKARSDVPKKWNAKWAGKLAGTISGDRKFVRINGKSYQCHRIIWVMENGPIPKGMQIDHIDGDALNNRIENLRIANHAENARNSRLSKNNVSGFKNVVFDTFCGLWLVSIHADGKTYRKRFKMLEDAVEFARMKRIELHGHFANHGNSLAEAA